MVDSKGETEAFGDLLRRHRVLAGITQEELAQSASLSARAISDLERGVKRTPRRDTVRLLVEALGLSGSPGQPSSPPRASHPLAGLSDRQAIYKLPCPTPS
jgi:transcriptional regulator with XRE-family HTH domain